MKEIGIIMSGNHPKLIIDGTKTMTRRVITPQPIEADDGLWDWKPRGKWQGAVNPKLQSLRGGLMNSMVSSCPYGQVGDRLWVRETWALTPEWDDGQAPCEIADFLHGAILYKADMGWEAEAYFKQDGGKWRPSIFMPRWASRITREITEVRVERLQEITEEDAKAEGIVGVHTAFGVLYKPAFSRLWDSLNAKRGYGWEVNLWVWVISFKEMPSGKTTS